MALAWKAGWGQPLAGSNPASSANSQVRLPVTWAWRAGRRYRTVRLVPWLRRTIQVRHRKASRCHQCRRADRVRGMRPVVGPQRR